MQELQRLLLIVVISSLLGLLALNLLSQSENCLILITGESVRVVNCGITKDLLELVRDLKPFAFDRTPLGCLGCRIDKQ
ncbi:TGB3 [Sweet potato C6 virus]|uniref:Movement protein TGBp3 n=1 Tax=Sweet potato C6 virus TaxID=1307958 RepID=J7GQ22_9VIRU|nr:TGB3 [Sweet potato C6 virus]AFP73391.1 TGB3 [Sweet potato C6 virus]AGH32543.1 triple gene block protein 3 [Sweet potato C6 virus]